MKDDLPASRRIVGMKQVLKAAESGINIQRVYVAADADESIRVKILSTCAGCNIDVEVTSCMEDLGSMCGIDVGAACVAVLEA